MDKKIEITDDSVKSFWVTYFRRLLPLSSLEHQYKEDIDNSIEGNKIVGDTAFICNMPLFKYTLIKALKEFIGDRKDLPNFMLVTGYSLCEVWVKDAELDYIKSLTDTYRPGILFIIIENKQARVSNKEYFNIIRQVITERSLRGKSTWIYYTGTQEDFREDLKDFSFDTVIPILVKNRQIKGGSSNGSKTTELDFNF